jgi:dihydroorotase-like cyclic amidohydrolase
MVDMDAHWRITETDMFSKDRQSPWEGVEGRGRPMAAMVRGRVVMRDGRPVGEPMGKLARPRPG